MTRLLALLLAACPARPSCPDGTTPDSAGACDSGVVEVEDTADTGHPWPWCEAGDDIPPSVVFEPLEDPQPAAIPLSVSLEATDAESDVHSVGFWYRVDGSGWWDGVALLESSEDPGSYGVTIEATDLTMSAGADYYVEVRDACTNAVTVPEGGAAAPLHVSFEAL